MPHRSQILALIADMQNEALSGGDLRVLFRQILEAFLAASSSAYGFVGEVLRSEAGHPYLRTFAISDISWDDESRRMYAATATGGMEFHKLDSLFGTCLRTGEMVIANSPSDDPRAGGMPHGHPAMSAFLAIPLRTRDTLLGMVGVANRPGGYDLDLVERLRPLTSTATALLRAHLADRERQRAEAELRSQRDQVEALADRLGQQLRAAEAANAAKTRFLAAMSHELRTPLNAVIGFAEVLSSDLSDGLSPAKRREYAGDVRDAGQHLLSLIDDLLDMARIEERRLALNITRQSVEALIGDALKMSRGVLEQRGLIPRFDIASGLPLVNADARAVRQIVINLVSNAAKFTPAGGRIMVSASDEGDFVRVTVSDTGCGIPAEILPRLGQPFVQARDPLVTGVGGLGLGLAISRQLVELQGGALIIDSAVGEGTRAAFTLPVFRQPGAPPIA